MSKVKAVKPALETVTMHVGGRDRVLQFDMNAFAELENKFGSIDAAMDQLQSGKMSDIKVILWAAFIHEEAVIDEETGEAVSYNITPYEVGSWIKNPVMLKEASELLTKAMGFTAPELSEAEKVAQLAKAKQEKNIKKAAQENKETKNS